MITDIKHINTENNSVISVDIVKHGSVTNKAKNLIDRSIRFTLINNIRMANIEICDSFSIITHIIINSPICGSGFILIDKIVVSKIAIMKGRHIYPYLLLPSLLEHLPITNNGVINHFCLCIDARIKDLTIRGSLSNFTLFTDIMIVKPNYFSPCIVYTNLQCTQRDSSYFIEYINPQEIISEMRGSKLKNIDNLAIQFFLKSEFSKCVGYDVVSTLINDAKMDGIFNIIVRIELCALKMGIVLVKDILDCIVSFLCSCL